MTILINLLSRKDLWKLPAGRHEDGRGLSLLVGKDGKSRSWTLRTKDASGVAVNRGLGGLTKVTVEMARERRDALLVAAAAEPDAPVPAAPMLSRVPTFLDRAREVIPAQTEGLRGKRPAYAWERSLLHYAKPLHGKKVTDITTSDVVAILNPIWLAKKPTARTVQKHMAKLFSSCIADELIDRNPAALADNLEHKMRKQKHTTKHHPAMPWQDVPDYIATLIAANTMGSLALAFTILTCVRSADAFAARRSDVDRNHIWTTASKNGLFARVPLTPKAQEVLRAAKALADKNPTRGDPKTFLFPGLQDGHLSHNAMLKLLKETHPHLTVHGFRSAFRTWGQEQTSIAHDTLEYCLHHIEGSRTEQAYMRGECLDKRRDALTQWADYLLPPTKLRLVA